MSIRRQIEKNEIIRLNRITKRYGGVTALEDVSFSINKGEVHSVVGENGAGKTTMMKLLSGIIQPDEGQIFIYGKEENISSPLASERLGISMVFQELNLFEALSVSANIFINNELRIGNTFLDEKTMCADAERVLKSLMVDINPTEKVANLSTGQKQIVEIARATHRGTNVVIMDEPNSALNDEETKVLFRIIHNLKDCGTTVIYVSHRLEEVFQIADRISVLRDGHYMGTWHRKKVSVEDIVAQVVGRKMGEIFPPRSRVNKDSKVSLEVKGLHVNGDNTPIAFNIREGEILGFAGLQGSGVQEVFETLFGIEKATEEFEVIFNGEKIKKVAPVELIDKGWGLIPADRRDEGLMLDWSILKNVSIVIVGRLLNRLGLIKHRKEREVSKEYIQKLSIATDSIDKKVINLSGGNQQKVVLAKWLSTEPTLLILNDPTRGIDVGTKQEIYRLIVDWAKQGYTILFTSSEIEEVLGVSHRVLVMYKGKLVKEFSAKQADKEEVMEYVLGGAELINEKK